jgi:hypothetical protein
MPTRGPPPRGWPTDFRTRCAIPTQGDVRFSGTLSASHCAGSSPFTWLTDPPLTAAVLSLIGTNRPPMTSRGVHGPWRRDPLPLAYSRSGWRVAARRAKWPCDSAARKLPKSWRLRKLRRKRGQRTFRLPQPVRIATILRCHATHALLWAATATMSSIEAMAGAGFSIRTATTPRLSNCSVRPVNARRCASSRIV